MRLFFDVDGVLLNFERAFVRWLNEHYGTELHEDYETSSWYFEDVLTAEQCREAWHVFLGSDDAAGMQPYLAPERFNALTENRSVHLLTNFPDAHMEKRARNLNALGFHYNSLHHCGFVSLDPSGIPSKADMIARLLQPGESGLFVDDHPKNCVDVAHHCSAVEVWLMSRRHNRDFEHPDVKRAVNWNCVIERLDGLNGNRPQVSAIPGGTPTS